MTTTEIQVRMDATEAEVLRWMGKEWDTKRLFWLRVEIGQDYLRNRYKLATDRKKVQDSPAFWKWWRQVWHINDRRWLAHLATAKLPEGAIPYEYWHDTESEKYYIKSDNLGVKLEEA